MLSQNEEGEVDFNIPVSTQSTEFTLMEIDSAGAFAKETTTLLFPEWEQFQSELKPIEEAPPPKKFTIEPGLGVGLFFYNQTGSSVVSGSINQANLVFRVLSNYVLKTSIWDIQGQGFISAIPFWSNPAGGNLAFTDLKLLLARSINMEATWRFKTLGGVYYSTFLSSGNLGYKNLEGVYAGLFFEKILRHAKKLSLSLGYTFLWNGSSFLSILSSSKLDARIDYQFALIKGQHPVKLFIDLMEINFSLIPNGKSQVYFTGTGLSYGF